MAVCVNKELFLSDNTKVKSKFHLHNIVMHFFSSVTRGSPGELNGPLQCSVMNAGFPFNDNHLCMVYIWEATSSKAHLSIIYRLNPWHYSVGCHMLQLSHFFSCLWGKC